MAAGRPRKHADNAARQAAYRERKRPDTPMNGREMRRAINDIHAWAKALCADWPGGEAERFAKKVLGGSAEETAQNIAEAFRKALYDGEAARRKSEESDPINEHFMRRIANL